MKKIVSFFLLLICSVMAVNGQTVKEGDVPTIIKQSLRQKYPHVKVMKWTLEKTVYEAEVILNKKEAEVAFDTTGHWVETESEIKVRDLPETVTKAILASEYKDWTIKEAEVTETPDNTVAYEMELIKHNEKVALLFSKGGNLVKVENE